MTSTAFTPWLGVFETLRVAEGVPLFLEPHRIELRRAATALGLNVNLDLEEARAALPKKSGRWRWIVTLEGSRTLFTEEAFRPNELVSLSVAHVRVGSQNWDARFKTLSYLTHAQAARSAATDEAVLLNEHGQVASAARGNIFWRRGHRLYTPAHEAGCRCGVVRGFVLALGPVEEGHFALDELIGADEIFLTNSLRGIVSVQALEGEVRADFSRADELRLKYEEAIQAIRIKG